MERKREIPKLVRKFDALKELREKTSYCVSDHELLCLLRNADAYVFFEDSDSALLFELINYDKLVKYLNKENEKDEEDEENEKILGLEFKEVSSNS